MEVKLHQDWLVVYQFVPITWIWQEPFQISTILSFKLLHVLVQLLISNYHMVHLVCSYTIQIRCDQECFSVCTPRVKTETFHFQSVVLPVTNLLDLEFCPDVC